MAPRLDTNELTKEAARLFRNKDVRGVLEAKLEAASVRNGVDVALEAIGRLSAPR